jgi:hypothetical protein
VPRTEQGARWVRRDSRCGERGHRIGDPKQLCCIGPAIKVAADELPPAVEVLLLEGDGTATASG